MQQATLTVTLTHDQYMRECHPDYRRVIRGKKHIRVYDIDKGGFVWAPVEIVPRHTREVGAI